VSREPLPPHRDDEFRQIPPEPSIADDPNQPIEAFQRLVANPFLGLLAFLAWLLALHDWVLNARSRLPLPLRLLMLLSGALLPLLFQYHCLDCGRSGSLLHSQRHACAPVLDRRRSGRPVRMRISFTLQFFVWILALLLLAVAIRAAGWLGSN
jgi:hypothetical protein